MARPPFTFDRNTLGSNGSFPLRSMAGPPFEGSQLKNISHFRALALRRDNPICRRAAHLSRGVLGLAVDMHLVAVPSMAALGLGCAKRAWRNVDALPLERCELPVRAVLQRRLAVTTPSSPP